MLSALSKLHRFDAQRSCFLSSTFILILTVNLLFSQLSTQHDHYSKTWKTAACRNVNAHPSRKPKNNTFPQKYVFNQFKHLRAPVHIWQG
ncbi:hypothetical protein CABS01_13051 [Colletotrichum abscissum]|uniref:uncharacterized protein n=1 Tax=Colletotrichum abscissum TaxID=1671311 RepID=UPI0027D758A9|nr:uncharacterized protein CABS01_13051 [Colletotrichum abscissum]KAK1486918.1 hypothetical protein CABS01_13051 [Colletotrichum abscissum]